MRALESIYRRLDEKLTFVHAYRRASLWRVTRALLDGKQLWLTGLGRHLPGDVQRKHAIKAVDRLLGNKHLHGERLRISAVLAREIISRRARPLILVDTVDIRHRICSVTASVAYRGRSFPILSRMVGAVNIGLKDMTAFLDELAHVLPEDCAPIFITDGGFGAPWLAEVEQRGWDYVGRVRGQTTFLVEDAWIGRNELHALAKKKARSLGLIPYPKTCPQARRIVLSGKPRSGHRQQKTRTGPGRDTNYHHYRKNAYEPLVLATSLRCNPRKVVQFYKTRMQIEQSFRDFKNHRWGWSLRHCGSRSKARVECLLLVASIAYFVQQLIGVCAERHGLHHQHQANTERRRRVISFFVLGGFFIRDPDSFSPTAREITSALREVRSQISALVLTG